MEKDGGQPLNIRAIGQAWLGAKLKLSLGMYAAKDISKVQGSSHPRFPFVKFIDIIIPLLPSQPEAFPISLPFTPYLLDPREEGEEEFLEIPDWAALLTASNDLFRNNTAPHVKNNADTMAEALKKDWKRDVPSKYQFPPMSALRAGGNPTVAPTAGVITLL